MPARTLPARPDLNQYKKQAKELLRTIVASEHFFGTWREFVEFKRQLRDTSSPLAQFERAVDAIVAGDADPLTHLLRRQPGLIRARSTRWLAAMDPRSSTAASPMGVLRRPITSHSVVHRLIWKARPALAGSIWSARSSTPTAA